MPFIFPFFSWLRVREIGAFLYGVAPAPGRRVISVAAVAKMSTKKNSDNNEKKQANNPRKSIFEGTRVAFVLNTPVNSRWVMFKVKFSSFYLDSPFLDVFRARCQG